MRNLSLNFTKLLLSAVFVICCSSFALAQDCKSGTARCPKGMICIDGEQTMCYMIESVSDSPDPTSCYEINCPMGLTCQLNRYGELICSVKGTVPNPDPDPNPGSGTNPCEYVTCPNGLICSEGNCIVPGTEPYQNTVNQSKNIGNYLTSFLSLFK